jgi:hypothetical protein
MQHGSRGEGGGEGIGEGNRQGGDAEGEERPFFEKRRHAVGGEKPSYIKQFRPGGIDEHKHSCGEEKVAAVSVMGRILQEGKYPACGSGGEKRKTPSQKEKGSPEKRVAMSVEEPGFSLPGKKRTFGDARSGHKEHPFVKKRYFYST